MGIGVVITTGWIGGVAVGEVHELDEESLIGQFFHNQLMLFAKQLK